MEAIGFFILIMFVGWVGSKFIDIPDVTDHGDIGSI